MVISKFKIGDEVETNEKYRKMAEDHNEYMDKISENGYRFPTYRKGKVTNFYEEDFNGSRTDPHTGLFYFVPFFKATDIIVRIDDSPEHSLNQDFLQKVKE